MVQLRWLLGCMLILGVWGCSDQPTNQPPASSELTGNISRVVVSDSTLTQMYRKVQADLPTLVREQLKQLEADPGAVQTCEQLLIYLPTLFYLRSMEEVVGPWLTALPTDRVGELADVYVQAVYYTYLQSGKKQLITDDTFPWETLLAAPAYPYIDVGHQQAADSSLLRQLMLRKRYEALTYLAIEAGKDSLARQCLQRVEQQTYDSTLTLTQTTQILSLAAIPLSDEVGAKRSRDLFGDLLAHGMEPQGGYLALGDLFGVLTQYEMGDAVMQMLDQAPSMVPGDTLTGQVAFVKWLCKEVIGMQPELDQPGLRRVRLFPHLVDGISAAEGQFKTAYGLVLARWDQLKPLRLQYEIPQEATLVLPVKNPTSATIIMNSSRLWMSGKPQPLPEGTALAGVDQRGIFLRVTEGKYTFQVKE